MSLVLYYHPFSSYSQKALIAFYENDIAFEGRILEGPDAPATREWLKLWPIARFPVLVDGDRTVTEASCIVEYLGITRPGPVRLLPEDPMQALQVRMLDRFFDLYVSTPQQAVVYDALRPADQRDPHGVSKARGLLDTAYAWLESHLDGRTWATGESFTLADCAAAPFLFYADWTHPLDGRFPRVGAYRQRLLGRPSFARLVDEARPYRSLFPLGAPDRD